MDYLYWIHNYLWLYYLNVMILFGLLRCIKYFKFSRILGKTLRINEVVIIIFS